MVEHSVHTRSVICSSQIAATRPVGQAVKTPPFHGGNMGSIPVRVTKKEAIRKDGFFFGGRRPRAAPSGLAAPAVQRGTDASGGHQEAGPRDAAPPDAGCYAPMWRRMA